MLCGNGTMGAMIYGNPHDETIIVNHALLYLPNTEPLKPIDQISILDEIRQAGLDGDFKKASRLPYELALKEGYGGTRWHDPYIPAFEIKIHMDAGNIEKYKRSVNFETGEAIVSWSQDGKTFKRQVFTSRADTVLVIKISGTESFNCQVELKQLPVEWDQWDYINSTVKKTEITAYDNTLRYSCEFNKKFTESISGFEGAGRIYLVGGSSRVKNNSLYINNANEIILLLSLNPYSQNDSSAFNTALNRINKLNPDYKDILLKHTEIHGELFNRVNFNLYGSERDRNLDAEVMMLQAKNRYSCAFIEKQFYASRYNILSATGIKPPNLQGIWGGTWTPPWSSVFTNDGNVPVAISSFMSSNLEELIMAYFRYHESLLPHYRENAKNLFGCRGINIPAHTGTHGYLNHFGDVWCLSLWTAGAGWVSSFFFDYYLYTGDITFLKERAYPFMKETAHFYEDFLIEGPNGRFIFNPSYSPENNPANSESQAVINATMDVMVARQLLKNCIKAGNLIGENPDKIKLWKEMLNKMPAYELNEKGELREWIWPELEENHAHRHVSHLYGLYDIIDPDLAADPELIDGARKVLMEKLKVRQADNGGIMVFGLVQLAWIAASLGNGKTVEEILQWLSAQYWSNSLATYHDPNGLFNMDLSGGFQQVIIKALLYSETGMIRILPALPPTWKQGEISGIKLRGQIEVKRLSWEENSINVDMVSDIDQTASISFPDEVKNIELTEGLTKNDFQKKSKTEYIIKLQKYNPVSLRVQLDVIN